MPEPSDTRPPEPPRPTIDPRLPGHQADSLKRALEEKPDVVIRPERWERPDRGWIGHLLALPVFGFGAVSFFRFWSGDPYYAFGAVLGLVIVGLYVRNKYQRWADEAAVALAPGTRIVFFERRFVVSGMLDGPDRVRLARVQRALDTLGDQGYDPGWVADTEWALAARLPILTLNRERSGRPGTERESGTESERQRRSGKPAADELFVDAWIDYLESTAETGIRPGWEPGKSG